MPNDRAFYDRLLTDWVPSVEGGYTPGLRVNAITADPETLFGVTIANWTTWLKDMPADAVSRLSPAVARQVRAIQETSSQSEGRSETSQLLRSVAQHLAPYGGVPQTSAEPVRATNTILPGRNEQQLAAIADLREVSNQIFYTNYVERPGFTVYPEYMAPHVIDFGINKGPPRARWAMAEALHDSGILPDQVYQQLPHLTATDIVVGDIFTEGRRGAMFSSHAVDELLAPYTRNLTAEQQQTLVSSYSQQRRDYHSARHAVQGDVFPERFVNAINNRVDQLEAYQREHWPFRDDPIELAALGLDVQFRRFGGDMGNGIMGLNDAIAIEIPNHGVFIYAVDREGNHVDNKPLPEGVEMLRPVEYGGGNNPNAIDNPYRYNTLTWLDADQNRRYLPITPDLAQQIMVADTTYIAGISSLGFPSTGAFDLEAGGMLMAAKSDQLGIRPSPDGTRLVVYDMDRFDATQGVAPYFSVASATPSENTQNASTTRNTPTGNGRG